MNYNNKYKSQILDCFGLHSRNYNISTSLRAAAKQSRKIR